MIKKNNEYLAIFFTLSYQADDFLVFVKMLKLERVLFPNYE